MPDALAGAVITEFYGRFGTVSLTLLGLWLVVVQTRYEGWAQSSIRRRRAAAVSLVFGLPGVMGLMSLIDPTTPALWRIAFGVGGGLGAVGLVSVAAAQPDSRQPTAVSVSLWAAGLLFGAVAVIAIVAGMPGVRRWQLSPLQTEAVLLSVLLLIGLVVAWLLLFEDGAGPAGET